ncbi:sodium:solute symporter family protein [Oceanobacillus halophilus]|uniref:Sodium:solute symporter family protein n=1 Tax=Oceanobacillus halophilus TaxID=930130 RepID=A0A494ZVX7_9BACI|nr:sodium:solute symporter family protein [Oceanobacillus halophilus]RKQ30383.1 sodium:solute symporter family protein [Oceanobacillus halophilus]
MSEYGIWILVLAFGYTAVLIIAGQLAKRKITKTGSYFVAGRNFNKWIVAFCITGLFSGSTYISILELSYLSGISAIWYGVAEMVQIFIIAFLIIRPFRKKMLVTISGLIGDKFGRTALGLSGAITAFAFPMWSVATAIAFASAIHVFTGISLTLSVAITAILLFVYLQGGGMWSIAFTQTINFFLFIFMFIVGMIAFFINPGIDGLRTYASATPAMFDWDSVGLQVIVAWFGTFLVNVILAQAAFQMALSAKSPEEGQKGMILAGGMAIPFIVCGVLFGIGAAIAVPNAQTGLIAIPQYLMEVLPAPLVGVFFLGVWACALGWGAPCQFSGATSLGRDTARAVYPQAKEAQLIKYTKISLLLLTALMIVFGMLRTEQSAWWNVLAWTMRNSATFAPVIAALFWPIVTRNAVVASLFTGFSSGLLWYHLGGWQPDQFFANIHPVWIGSSVNVITIIVGTLLDKQSNWTIQKEARIAYVGLGLGIALTFINVLFFNALYQNGLLGLFGFAAIMSYFIAAIQFFKPIQERQHSIEERVANG